MTAFGGCWASNWVKAQGTRTRIVRDLWERIGVVQGELGNFRLCFRVRGYIAHPNSINELYKCLKHHEETKKLIATLWIERVDSMAKSIAQAENSLGELVVGTKEVEQSQVDSGESSWLN